METIYNKKEMKKEQLINNLGDNISMDRYNQAQLLNSVEWTTKYGKVANAQLSNTRLGRNIAELPQHNFGSIGEYIVDTLPSSMITVRGVEKTEVLSECKTHNGKQIISRRFICKLLSTWGYIAGIPYDKCIKMWADDIENRLPNGKFKSYKMVSGNQAISIIKDFLYLIRHKSFYNIKKHSDRGIISEQLHNVIWGIIHDKSLTEKEIEKKVMTIKDKLYYNHQALDIVWAYPKYNVEYLIGLIKELQSGNYMIDMYVPIIHQLKKYPIICKDTHLKPRTDIEHQKNKDDYDIGKYIWEDY